MLRLNVPSVFLYGGSILPGKYKNKDVTVQDVFEAVGSLMQIKLLEKALCFRKLHALRLVHVVDNFVSKYNGMCAEAIGLAIPGSSSTPAPYESRDKYAYKSGVSVMNLIENKLNQEK